MHGRRDLFRPSDPAEKRKHARVALDHLRGFIHGQGRIDDAGSDAVHPDAALSVFDRGGLGEGDDAGLGGGVFPPECKAPHGGDRRDVDNGAPAAHSGCRLPDTGLHAENVYAPEALRPRLIGIGQQVPRSNTRIVHHDIELAEPGDSRLAQPGDIRRVTNIGAAIETSGARRGGTFRGQIRNEDVRPRPAQAACNRRADAGRTACNDRRLPR
jgi:hypothetical protein